MSGWRAAEVARHPHVATHLLKTCAVGRGGACLREIISREGGYWRVHGY